MNDLDVNTQYDVDDSVYVYEELSGDPLLTTITDHREVSGGGKKNLKQGFSSAIYSAESGVKADSGSVESNAFLTLTSLSATQTANIGGFFAQSYLTGSQNYFGGIAFTGQYLSVDCGMLSTVQTLSLGRSIYSTQSFQASGYNPLAVGYALVDFHGLNSFDSQGAFIVAGACKEGSISGNMGAEVIKVPDNTAIDPIAYGSNMVAQGDEAAGIIAGAGDLKGIWSQNQFANFNGLDGQGAFAGAVGIGEDSRASVDYIQAQTDGQETSAFEVDAKAKGDEAAIVAAGAGKFNRNTGFGLGPSSFFSYGMFDMQGALAGAIAIGSDSRAKADWVGAFTDGEITSAMGDDLKAKSDGFAGVGAGAGSLYLDYRLMGSPFFFARHDGLGAQGAIAGAAALGENSKVMADHVGAETDGDYTYAWGSDLRAKSDGFAGLVAGAGSFYMDHGLMNSPFFFATNDNLGVQGALAGAVAGGENSRVSANHIEAYTDGRTTFADGHRIWAHGDEFAGLAAGAGSLYLDHGLMDSSFFSATNDNLGVQGALAGAVAGGDDSMASADFVGALTDGEETFSEGHRIWAHGDEFAGVGAAAGSLYMDRGLMQSPFFFGGFESLDMQGAIAGAAAGGEDSIASAGFVSALTDGEETFAEGHRIWARGDDFAGVVAGAGSLYMSRGLMQSPFLSGSYDSLDIQGAIAGAAAGGDDSRASANFIGALTDGEETFAEGHRIWAHGDDFAGVGAAAGSLYMDRGLMQSPFFFGGFESLDIQGAIAGAAAGGEDSIASAGFVGALTDGEETFAEGYGVWASGDEFAATGAGAVSIREQEYSINPVWPYISQDTQGAIVADIGFGEDSFASADYIGAGTDGDQTSAVGIDLMARGKRSAHAIVGAGEDIYLDNGVLKIEQGSATGLNALDNGEVRAALMYAGTGDITESFGLGMQAMGDESALAYTASGDKLTVWADSIRVKDGTMAGLGAKGAMSQVLADELFSDRSDAISTSHVNNLIAEGKGVIAATASGEKIDLMLDKAEVDTGSLTGAAANKDAMVTSANLASFKSAVSDLSMGEMLAAGGDKSAVLATGKGAKVTIKADEDEGRAKVEQGTIAGVAAYKNAWVSGYELASGEIDLDIGTLVMDGEGSMATGLIGSGDKSAALASGAGEDVVIVADEDKGRAKVEEGSITGVTAFKNAMVGGGLLASGQMQVAVGTQMLDVQGSAGMGLGGSGDKSAALASGAGESVVTKANKNEGSAEVEKGTITGATAFKNAQVASDLLASGEMQLTIDPLVLDGMGSLGTGLSASGDDSASGASGFGEVVFTKANNQMGEAKVTNGGITGMAAHESAQVSADLLGSAGIAGLSAAGWIGMNPSATGTISALGTGFGSEVNIEADAAVVETTAGSIIGITASGANSRTSADSIVGYETVGVSTLGAANVLAWGDFASAASATSPLSTAVIESDKISVNGGSVVGMAAASGQVEADSLGFSNLYPSGTNLKASGSSATAASAIGLGMTTLQANKVTVNTGSMVGLATENGEITASNLGFNGLSSIGSILTASGSKSIIAAGAGNEITLQPGSAKVKSITIDPNGVLLALGAGGNSQLYADSLEASKGLTTSVAKGFVLQATGTDYSMIAAASSGSIAGGTIINFQPSSGASPYYGMTIPWGAYGGARTDGGTVTANQLMAKSDITSITNTNYIIGGPNAGTSTKDYATLQASGTQPVVFAAYKSKSLIDPSPSVATKTDNDAHTIWAYRNTVEGKKEAN